VDTEHGANAIGLLARDRFVDQGSGVADGLYEGSDSIRVFYTVGFDTARDVDAPW
jgi:hypothetical protein